MKKLVFGPLRYAPCEHSVLLFTFAFVFQWLLFSPKGHLAPLEVCCNFHRGEPPHRHQLSGIFLLTYLFPDAIYNWSSTSIGLQECYDLSAKCWYLTSIHTRTIRGPIKDDRYLCVTLSDQMHHICDKYDSIVEKLVSAEEDSLELGINCHEACVFFSPLLSHLSFR